jgi:plastocyanin
MHALRSLTLLAPLALLWLAACGQSDVEIDPEAVARYGAFRYERGATTGATSGTGGGGATTVAVAVPPAGVPAAAPAASDPPAAPAGGPAGGAKPRAKAPKYEVIAVTDGGTIKISCKASKMLEPFVFPLNKNQEGCGHTTMPSERAVIDPTTLGLKNCVVSLVEIAKGKDFEGEMAKAERLVILDQKSCRYVPHVALVRAGTKISVKNSDPVEHNAKSFFNNKATLQFNVMSSSGSLQEPSDETHLKKAGNYIVACDIHFWMTGYIRAVSHPYWAVTAEDGTATLTNVPPGTYKVACWHEGMLMSLVQNGAEVSDYKFSADFELPPQDATVTAGATCEVAFTIEPR